MSDSLDINTQVWPWQVEEQAQSLEISHHVANTLCVCPLN